VVYEAVTDPEVPTLPPHITFKQARNFTASMLKGDPDAPAMIRGAFKDAIESFIPHKE
jgi:pyruvate dehydrogenase (quinone)